MKNPLTQLTFQELLILVEALSHAFVFYVCMHIWYTYCTIQTFWFRYGVKPYTINQSILLLSYRLMGFVWIQLKSSYLNCFLSDVFGNIQKKTSCKNSHLYQNMNNNFITLKLKCPLTGTLDGCSFVLCLCHLILS